ncbi:chaperone modulator CbpM [Larkinella arboricola]|uniref:MerR-like DNA binding protein n=1 Tax=Larkinella arboricola TaxID=643671 RepID=A0A327X0G2_LARAB|nr:chaperone modulator CbpM [Larkinella arboricola]RAJ99940.1 MerR-like DNA binding protein [Larkinella arboricola]
MLPDEVILVEDYCQKYTIDQTFVLSLAEYGLIELVVVEEQQCIPFNQLQAVEKFSNLHYDLNVNLDGIDVINHLLQRIKFMQEEIRQLKTQLAAFQ